MGSVNRFCPLIYGSYAIFKTGNYRAIFEQSGPSWGREAGLNTIKLSEVSLLNCIGAGGFGKGKIYFVAPITDV